MKRTEILNQTQEIYRDILDDEEIVLNDSTTTDDIEEWDSLTHVQLIVGLEKHFKIKFTAKEMLSWNNIGEMINCIESK